MADTQKAARHQPLRFHAEKCTAYKLGSFGYRRIELRSIDVRVAPYAQHVAALHVEWVEKGKRTRMGGVEDGSPSLVVLAGHGHPSPGDPMKETTSEGDRALGVRASVTRWTCWAPEWIEDFERTFDPYFATHEVLADWRGFDVTAGGRYLALSRGAPLTAGDRVTTPKGSGTIVRVTRDANGVAAESFQVRLDEGQPDTILGGDGRLHWLPAFRCSWEGHAAVAAKAGAR